MTTKQIRSRILEFLPKDCLLDIYQICMSKKIRDNNSKVDAVVACLNKYKVDFVELGPGTNRFAVLIDGYVFKIALDKWGIQDNKNELTVSEELQPYVSKTYECNDLILVAEYVTVISKEEFAKKRHEIEKILAIISEGYLLGDVGMVPKNFCNWGYRDTGELVILDYAYIYRIIGDEMLCSVLIDQDTGQRCGTMLTYDDNFHTLYCPKCRTKYSTVDIRRRIPVEHERYENEMAKQLAYKVDKPLTLISAKEEDNSSLNINNNEEESQVAKEKLYAFGDEFEDYNYDDVEIEKSDEDYVLDALSIMQDDEDDEDDILGSLTESINGSEITDIVSGDIETYNSFVNNVENVREIKETTVTISDEDGIRHTHTTEIETDDESIVITLDMIGEIHDNDEDDIEVIDDEDVEVVEPVVEPTIMVEETNVEPVMEETVEPTIEIEVTETITIQEPEVEETPQQLSLEIPEEDEPEINMTSLLISSAKIDDDEGIDTTMADAFRELGLDIPEDSKIEKVSISETTTTTLDVEFAHEHDIESLRAELESDLDEYTEYEEDFDMVAHIQKMKSTNRDF